MENVSAKKMEEEGIPVKERLVNILYAFIIGVAFDLLFYKKSLGISYLLFVMLLISFFMYSARERIRPRRAEGLFVLGVILLLSLNFVIHSNMFLSALSFLAVPFLIVVYTILATAERPDWSKPDFLVDMMERIFPKALSNIFKPFTFIKGMMAKGSTGEKNRTRKSILIGLAVSLPILLFVVPLLASADMAFEYYIRNITKIFDNLSVGNAVSHIILIVSVSLYVFGYAWSFKYRDGGNTVPSREHNGSVDPTIIITVLTVVNFVYLLFTIVQSSYLYGGMKNMLPDGFTYAEYARRGFFELCTVAVINFIVLLISMMVVRKDTAIAGKVVRVLLSILVGFTSNMLFSAYYKLSLYEESFGFTESRIYAHIFMVFMALLFICALIRIWYEKMPLFKSAAVLAVITFVTLNYMNIDRMIARNNIDRYYRTGKIDAYYLTSLSYDAVPEIIELADDKNSDVAGTVREGLSNKKKVLDRGYTWVEFNYSRARAKRILDSFAAGGAK